MQFWITASMKQTEPAERGLACHKVDAKYPYCSAVERSSLRTNVK